MNLSLEKKFLLAEDKTEQFKKIERAIIKFLKEQVPKEPGAKTNNYGFDFDISDPKMDDMKKISSGQFTINKLRTSPTSEACKLSFHFYVGKTEFHLQGKAADRIYELIAEDNN
jgi:hypothetical protein